VPLNASQHSTARGCLPNAFTHGFRLSRGGCVNEGLGMRKTLALGIGVVALTGCALPVPLQVASWALDGISYIATDKSVTDHGLSIVAQQDCALLRGVTEGKVCRDWDDAATLVADAGNDLPPAPPVKEPNVRIGYAHGAQSDIPPLSTEIAGAMPDVETLANFDTAAGPTMTPPTTVTRPMRAVAVTAPANRYVPARNTRQAAKTAKAIPAAVTVKKSAKPIVLPVTATVKLPVLPAAPSTAVRLVAETRTEPTAGIYYVIGSFRNYGNAQAFASRYETLVPDVLAAKLDGAPVYRVVVGPLEEGREKRAYRRVTATGLTDPWAIRVMPGDWLLARKVIKRKRPAGQELARATQ